jgi:hypothetical protein
MKKILAVVVVVLLVASASYAESIFQVLASAIKATASGVNNVVRNADPGKVVSDTVEGAGETTQVAEDATVGTARNIAGTVSEAVGSK